MSTAQHTPGPWFASRKYEVGPRSDADDQSFGMIVPLAYAYGVNREANARLIAAAPDLLEALGELMEWEEEIAADLGVHTSSAKPMLAKARAAIAKAKGAGYE